MKEHLMRPFTIPTWLWYVMSLLSGVGVGYLFGVFGG